VVDLDGEVTSVVESSELRDANASFSSGACDLGRRQEDELLGVESGGLTTETVSDGAEGFEHSLGMRVLVDRGQFSGTWALNVIALGEVTKGRVWVSWRPDILPGLVVKVLALADHQTKVVFGDELGTDVLLYIAFLGA